MLPITFLINFGEPKLYLNISLNGTKFDAPHNLHLEMLRHGIDIIDKLLILNILILYVIKTSYV